MARRKKKAPELTFQQHVADYLVHQHKYGVLEQSHITDTTHYIAEDQLWAFLKATQSETLQKLEDDYGTDAWEEGRIQAASCGSCRRWPRDARPSAFAGPPLRRHRQAIGTPPGRSCARPPRYAGR